MRKNKILAATLTMAMMAPSFGYTPAYKPVISQSWYKSYKSALDSAGKIDVVEKYPGVQNAIDKAAAEAAKNIDLSGIDWSKVKIN